MMRRYNKVSDLKLFRKTLILCDYDYYERYLRCLIERFQNVNTSLYFIFIFKTLFSHGL